MLNALTALRATIAAAIAPPTATLRLGDVELLPHQCEAVVFLQRAITRFGGALLADGVGLGKTYSALGVARDYQRILVLHPAALRDMWKRALALTRVAASMESYERLSGARADCDERYDLVILDEAHHVRTSTTRRFRRAARLTWGADVLLLSATPLHNRPRELVTLLSLFLGARAESLDDATLGHVICRRTRIARTLPLPAVHATRWHTVPAAPAVLDGIMGLPPPFRLRDQGTAPALMRLALIRHWCSSDAALRASLRLRLTIAESACEYARGGRMPTLAMVRRLIADESTLQLDLFAMLEGDAAPAKAAASLRQHVRHLRALLALLDRHGRDAARIALLSEMLSRHRARRAILFTHSIPTAQATFTALAPRHRLACLTSRGARLASGTLPRSVVLDAFRPRSAAEPIAVPAPNAVGLRTPAARIDALVATDVLSEGVDLHDASLLVHLDLPWTESRLQQRVGRLRRLGSPHADVVVEALAPPSASDALYGIVRRLAEKAGLAEYYVGRATNDKPRALSEAPGVPGSNAGHQRDAGTTGNPSAFDQHIAPGTCAPSPADRAEQVRTVISPWRQALRGVTLTDSNQPLVACCAGSVAGFVAVIEDELGPLVVARADGAGRDDVRADPTPVGRLLEGLSPIELDVDAPAADRARAHVARLIDGLDIIDDESRVMSGAQLRALRALRHTLGVRSRESRPALLTRLAHASERVRRARGAGASFAIADWLSALGGARPTLEKVAELDGALLARERSRAPRGAARLTALLLVLAMPAGFD